MMVDISTLLQVVVYILSGRLILRPWSWIKFTKIKYLAFALLNLVAFGCFLADDYFSRGKRIVFGVYIALVIINYLFTKTKPLVGILFPLVFMVVIKYALSVNISVWFIGISYVAFRLSHFALLVQNEAIVFPSIWSYLGYAFFVPIMPIGPIQGYDGFEKSLNQINQSFEFLISSLLRIVVGSMKFIVLANLCAQTSYESLLSHSLQFPRAEITIAMYSYFLFLYFNFSGACDVAIGIAGLIGIEIEENFNSPFLARNIREFWNRWHMTLSKFMRDMVFSPFSKFLVRRWGPRMAQHSIAISIAIVFILIGIWHGFALNFVIFGLIHAIGVGCTHYYTLFLKRNLSPKNFKNYMNHKGIEILAILVTLSFMSFSLLFFGNSFSQAKGLLLAWLMNKVV